MTLKEGPIRRLASKLSRSGGTAQKTESTPTGSTPTAAAEEPQVRETICAPKPVPKRCLNEAGHKALR
jgi:hypothetical protein